MLSNISKKLFRLYKADFNVLMPISLEARLQLNHRDIAKKGAPIKEL